MGMDMRGKDTEAMLASSRQGFAAIHNLCSEAGAPEGGEMDDAVERVRWVVLRVDALRHVERMLNVPPEAVRTALSELLDLVRSMKDDVWTDREMAVWRGIIQAVRDSDASELAPVIAALAGVEKP